MSVQSIYTFGTNAQVLQVQQMIAQTQYKSYVETTLLVLELCSNCLYGMHEDTHVHKIHKS